MIVTQRTMGVLEVSQKIAGLELVPLARISKQLREGWATVAVVAHRSEPKDSKFGEGKYCILKLYDMANTTVSLFLNDDVSSPPRVVPANAT